MPILSNVTSVAAPTDDVIEAYATVQYSLSLIRSICYPESVTFSTKAKKWGCDHEKTSAQDTTGLVFVSWSHLIELVGKVDRKIVYFCLKVPMTCSMWIRTHDNFLAVSTSMVDSCFLPQVNGGIFSSTQCRPTLCCTVCQNLGTGQQIIKKAPMFCKILV